MNKKTLFGILAFLIPTFPLGFLWHLSWFYSAYESLNIYRPDVVIPMGLASMFIQAVFFSWSYPKLLNTEYSGWIRSSFLCFFTFGLLAWSYTVLPIAAKYQMASISDFVSLETGFTVLQFGVVAPLMALVFRDKKL